MKQDIFSENRRARFDYEILENFEAGLVLTGTEVKSVKNGKANLTGATVIIRGNQGYLAGADIPAYQPKNAPPDYDPLRVRPLLLRQSELAKLASAGKEKKLTIVPLKLYNKANLVKLEIGLGRRRKKSDKRDVIKKRETKREMKRVVR